MSRITRQSKSTSGSKPETPEASRKSNMAEPKKELTLQDVIDQMKTSLNELEIKLEKKIDENTKSSDERCRTTDDKLDKIESNTSSLSDRVVELEKEVDTQNKVIHKLMAKVDSLDEERRNHNVIIEGLQEDNNGSLRRKLDDLFEFLGVSFDNEWADTAYRVGVKQEKSKRPRSTSHSSAAKGISTVIHTS